MKEEEVRNPARIKEKDRGREICLISRGSAASLAPSVAQPRVITLPSKRQFSVVSLKENKCHNDFNVINN